jgi:hypothetical protein
MSQILHLKYKQKGSQNWGVFFYKGPKKFFYMTMALLFQMVYIYQSGLTIPRYDYFGELKDDKKRYI